ncbi:sirohydrochlorin chelatase [Longimicrobium sp.]|uniref:sirohydrochlorin chelatase n=1 Tax=Longimicrobium sp. TaxID=2029185 RepID=UPI002E318BC0|nr:CbiX/SirB N-terminal domain-containing protein [Longimicrobium sp.]HEX6037634.1 CbiX/SirB N-terminal domain-containing protein [Longimicrobium sp.]
MKGLRMTAAALLLAAFASPATAQNRVGTLILAHGGDKGWNDQVRAIASRVNTGGPVEVSFLMGPEAPAHRFQDAAERLEAAGASEIVVVPLLVSSHSGHYEQIRWLAGETDALEEMMQHHLHMAGIERADVNVPIHVARAIDDSPEVARVLADRALTMQPQSAGRALYLLGHGPNDDEAYAQWMRNLRPVADSVRAATGFAQVGVGLVRDDAPAEVRAAAVARVRAEIQAQHAATGQPVIVVPVLISRGSVSEVKFRADLEGLPVVYSGETLLPHPGLSRWIEARVRERAGAASGAHNHAN